MQSNMDRRTQMFLFLNMEDTFDCDWSVSFRQYWSVSILRLYKHQITTSS